MSPKDILNNNFLILIIVLSILAIAIPDCLSAPRTFEEIVVGFEVPRLIRKDIFAQYDGNNIYLPTVEIFRLLELVVDDNLEEKQISGYVINREHRFTIDMNRFEVRSGGKKWPLVGSDFYMGKNDLYLRLDLFDRLFGLKMDFNFSALRVFLPLNRDFPSYQKLLRKQEHEKLMAKSAALKDILVIPRQRDILSAGALDWAFSASPIGGGGHYYDMGIGAMLFGGDLSVATNGNTETGFDPDQTTYRWHYYVNDNQYLSQAELGFINTPGPLTRSLKGGMITNKPQTERKYFQTINLTGYLGQGWEVELYIDQKLTDFQATDQTGEYDFNIDIFYGASLITLKMYGPNGEMRSEERYVRIPYNLIPKGDFEYSLAGGQSSYLIDKGNYGQGIFYYGIADNLTFGVAYDMPYQSKTGEKESYSSEITFQPNSAVTLNGSFSPGNADRYSVNLSRPTSANINGAYTKFYPNKFRNKLGQQNSAQLSISSPFKLGGKYLGLRYNMVWDKYPGVDYMNMTYGFNTSFNRLQIGYTGKYKMSMYEKRTARESSSQMLVSALFVPWIQPQFKATYDHREKYLTQYAVILNKRMFKTGQLAVTFERNELTKSNIFMLTLNFFTGFANFTTRALTSGKTSSMSQVQRGSVRFDSDVGRLRFDRRTAIGFGTAAICPFQDRNFNGVRDKDEDYLPGVRAKIQGGREQSIGRGKSYYYDGLRPYEEYVVSIDQNSIDNPTLRPTHETYKISCNPNVVTSVEVPMVTVSELSGSVWRSTNAGKVGIGGIKILILNMKTESLDEITAFSNGEYFYEGLVPGTYRIYIDPSQLAHYGYLADPEVIDFEVKPEDAGTIKQNVDFVLYPKEQP
jgi:hypothetical protein